MTRIADARDGAVFVPPAIVPDPAHTFAAPAYPRAFAVTPIERAFSAPAYPRHFDAET